MNENTLTGWKPVSRPSSVSLRGRTVSIEPLDAQRHAAPLWEAAGGHDDLWTWMTDGPYTSQDAFRESLERKQAAQDAVFLAILPVEENQALGFASWMRIDTANGVAEVGNILLSPHLQRTTAATEAMFLMACYIFDTLGYRRYEWKCNAENAPSRRAALRLGFSFEGVFRQHMVVKGKNRDTAWFAMLDREWPDRKRALQCWLEAANFDENGRQIVRLEAFQTG